MVGDLLQFINVGVAGVLLLWFMFRLGALAGSAG